MLSRKKNIVDVKNLSIVYNKFTAVNDISFTVDEGETLGILGTNGAGKSSTLRVLAGVLNHTNGTVKIMGNDMSVYKEADYARSIIGYCPDTGGLISQSTLRELVGFCLSAHGKLNLMPSALNLVEDFRMTEFLDTVVAGYSHGMSRRASCILAILSSYNLLILDEPFDGVDRIGVRAIKDAVNMAKKHNVGIIISTHLQGLLAESTDTIMIMHKGRILDKIPSKYLLGAEGIELYSKITERADEGLPVELHHASLLLKKED